MLTISTFNIQNTMGSYHPEKTNKIIKYLQQNKIDILNLQELFLTCEKDLYPQLEKIGYQIYGDYRYKTKIMTKINEKTPIITNRKIIEERTYHLPYLPSTLKRIATKAIIEDEKLGNICIINTHLDFMFEFAKKRQLKHLLKMIDNVPYPIILTGDFNLKNNHEIFKKFKKELQKRNIYQVPINEKTLKCSKYHRAIDHVFLSNNFKVIKQEVIKDIKTSDHYPVLVKIK